MSNKVNILFITSDQHRGDCFGFEGRQVKTPHLDKLAAEGAGAKTIKKQFLDMIASRPVDGLAEPLSPSGVH